MKAEARSITPKELMLALASPWAVAAFSLLAYVTIAWLHVQHRQAVEKSAELIDDFRQARVDLSAGFLQVMMARNEDEPLDRWQGLSLLEQAILELRQAVQEKTFNAPLLGATNTRSRFEQAALAFEAFLGEVDEFGQIEPETATRLRIAFYELERQADQIDQLSQQELTDLGKRLHRKRQAAMAGAGAMLLAICGGVYLSNRSRLRSVAAMIDTEDRLKTVVENMAEGLVIADLDGNLIHWNPAALAMVRCASSDDIGDRLTELKELFELRTRSGQPIRYEQWPLNQVCRGETVRGQEIVVRRVDQEWERVFSFNGTLAQASSGKTLAFLSIRDVTERAMAEEELRRSKRFLKSLRAINRLIAREHDRTVVIRQSVDIISDEGAIRGAWIALCDEEGQPQEVAAAGLAANTVTAYNSGFVDYRPAWAGLGTRICGVDVFREPVSPDFLNAESGNPTALALLGVPLACHGKTYGYFALTVARELSEDSEELTVFSEIAEDLAHALYWMEVAELREKETRELALAKVKAESANRSKDEFLAVMSHELRTPLNPIMGFASLVALETEDPEVREHMEAINDSSNRMLRLIDNILDYARLDRSTLEPELAVFSPHEVCRAALRDARPIAHQLDLSWVNGFADLKPLPDDMIVKGEKQGLLRILDNLLNNACKYTSSGFVRLESGLAERYGEQQWLHFAVVDSGIGVCESMREKLFEPFTQADSAYARRYEGAGLGLAICKKLVSAMGGEISLASSEEHGSRFSVIVPVQLVSDIRHDETAPLLPEPFEPRLRGRALVVEDDAANRALVTAVLKKTGLEVETATNGKVAVRICKETEFDLVVMDLCMPEMDGFDAAAFIRANKGANRNTPIIALSANVDHTTRVDCSKSGMDACLFKPIEPAALLETVRDYLKPPQSHC